MVRTSTLSNPGDALHRMHRYSQELGLVSWVAWSNLGVKGHPNSPGIPRKESRLSPRDMENLFRLT